MKLLLVLLLATTAVSSLRPLQQVKTATKPKAEEDDAAKWLLPKTVSVTSYNLDLITHIDKFDETNNETFSFDGTVDIKVTVKENVKAIILHKAVTLTISSATLLKDGDTGPKNLKYDTYDAETEKQSLIADTDIVAGDYTITIKYTGYHKDDMSGFYRSYYTTDDGKKRWLVTTQFESYNARAAYPCFDEPEYKASYVISISVNKDLVNNEKYSVLSNMPLQGDKVDSGEYFKYTFQSSAVPISSYLVAFIVSDFSGTTPATFGNGKEFRTWGRATYIDANQGSLSQIAGPAALDVLEDLLKIEFAYPKMDQVGIPDFSAGAMENWGLVTYRERLIFYDEKLHPTSQKQSVVTVTTHEFGHQWFGDLVTLHWWSDIWLNEGFATFFEYHATDKIAVDGLDTSSWKIIPQMVVDELEAGAFVTDGLANSRPLTKVVYTPGEIDANFDNVAYSKGGSVIRMWMHILGEDKFYLALNNYLKTNQGKVGTPELLLAEFEKVADTSVVKPSTDFVNWHTLAGYPVVNVTCQSGKCKLTQERYLFAGEDTTNPKWTIPITFTTSKDPNFDDTKPKQFFKQDAESLEVPYEGDWVLFNIQQTGYYRVNYDEAGWNALINVLHDNHVLINEINRAQLLDDSLNLARAEKSYLDYEVALNLTKYLANERELIPWKAALNGFNFLYGKLAGDPTTEAKIRAHILSLISIKYDALALETTSHTQKLLRSLVTSWACKLEYEPCVRSASGLFSAVAPSEIDPDVRTSTLCTAIRAGGKVEWDAIWKLYTETNDNAVQTQLLSALGCSKSEAILDNFLKLTLNSNSGIRKQDLSSVFSAVYNGNPTNVAVAFQFLIDYLEDIANAYGGILDPLGGLISGIASKLGSEEDVAKMEELLKKIESSDNTLVLNAKTGATEAVATVKSNKAWLDKKQAEIVNWLVDNYPEEGNGSSAVSPTSLTIIIFSSVSAYILNF